MAVVQPIFIEKTINYWNELIKRGKVKLNGQYVNYDIFRTIQEGNELRKYLYLETETGHVEEAQLLTNMNEVLAIKPYKIDKAEDGLVLVFAFELTIKEKGN
ncbi:hypothetical protein F9U64_01125 [Gracilibacillus oryzae]|uniref:Uncharacterized protein n=1 Tax=Gracilibacillus oryzae TaxID=1672701 RepID=A0A7C8KUY4_9BACI|nr:hypothetical protein [Gracilibacillus oryzae]KAB8139255.1 hypothetical protein F9U64_01125 [Gracilibacillus oryzae]